MNIPSNVGWVIHSYFHGTNVYQASTTVTSNLGCMSFSYYPLSRQAAVQGPMDLVWAWTGGIRRGINGHSVIIPWKSSQRPWVPDNDWVWGPGRQDGAQPTSPRAVASMSNSSICELHSEKWRWSSFCPKKQMLKMLWFWLVHLQLRDEISGISEALL